MRWALASLWIVFVGAAVSCKKTDADDTTDRATASAEGAEAVASPKPASEFDEASFSLAFRAKGPYRAGQAGAAEIILEAKPPYHCNDQYPYKFKAAATPGVQQAAPVVKQDALVLEKQRAVMPVQFTPTSAGTKTVAGQFAFSVCRPDRCLVERRDLALDISVE